MSQPDALQQATERLDAATGVPGLNRNDVYEVRAPLPEAAEQSRIAAVLDAVDEAIAKTEAVIAKLKQVRAGLLTGRVRVPDSLDLSA